jgi:hypothetical protein
MGHGIPWRVSDVKSNNNCNRRSFAALRMTTRGGVRSGRITAYSSLTHMILREPVPLGGGAGGALTGYRWDLKGSAKNGWCRP